MVVTDFRNFKKYSVLEHINKFLNSDKPFGIENAEFHNGYTIFSHNDYQISVKRSNPKEVAIRDVVLYSTTAISYCNDVDTGFESLTTPSCSYYKSDNMLKYKEQIINGVSHCKTSSSNTSTNSYTSNDDYGKYQCVKNNTATEFSCVHTFESKFTGSVSTNITIQEQVDDDGVVVRSTVFFRSNEFDPERVMMYNMDIFKRGEESEVIVSTGYRADFTFMIQSPDASLVNIFNNLYTFQIELGLDKKEHKVFELFKRTIINKLEYYYKLGGKMCIVNTMLHNIKEAM